MERDEDDRDYGLGFGEEDDWNSEASYRGHGGWAREHRNREDNNLGSIKMKIPSFQGRSNPQAYLEWEKKVEFVFDCYNYSEAKKVKLTAIEFSVMPQFAQQEKKWRETGEHLGGNEDIDEDEVYSKPLLPGVIQKVAGAQAREPECGGLLQGDGDYHDLG